MCNCCCRLLKNCSGQGGAKEKVEKVRGNCHRSFKTRAQAEAFMKDWKDSFAEVCRQLVREALDQPTMPRNINLSVEEILGSKDLEKVDIADDLKTKLHIKDEVAK
jgi:hypothetical protein